MNKKINAIKNFFNTWNPIVFIFGIYIFALSFILIFGRMINILGNHQNAFFFIPSNSNNHVFDMKIFIANTNFIPFNNIYNYLMHMELFNIDIIVNNLMGSILLFIPLGFLLPVLNKKFNRFNKTIKISLALSLTIEILQYLFRVGQFDIDDIILNTIGSILGFYALKVTFLLYNFILKTNVKKSKAQIKI
jgi:glycopeptide antibiotics resistance protein